MTNALLRLPFLDSMTMNINPFLVRHNQVTTFKDLERSLLALNSLWNSMIKAWIVPDVSMITCECVLSHIIVYKVCVLGDSIGAWYYLVFHCVVSISIRFMFMFGCYLVISNTLFMFNCRVWTILLSDDLVFESSVLWIFETFFDWGQTKM